MNIDRLFLSGPIERSVYALLYQASFLCFIHKLAPRGQKPSVRSAALLFLLITSVPVELVQSGFLIDGILKSMAAAYMHTLLVFCVVFILSQLLRRLILNPHIEYEIPWYYRILSLPYYPLLLYPLYAV